MRLSTLARHVFAAPQPVPRRFADWLDAPASARPLSLRMAFWLTAQTDAVFADLSRSPTFAAMLEQVPDLMDIPVVMIPFRAGSRTAGIYDPARRLIGVNYTPRAFDYFRPRRAHLLNVVAHEMRHGFQFMRPGSRAMRGRLWTEAACLKGFMMEADACAFQATVAWELKHAGVSGDYWRHFRAGKLHIAEAFKAAVAADPAALYDGRAQTAAALAWFGDEESANLYAQEYMDNLKEWMAVPPAERAREAPGGETPAGGGLLVPLPWGGAWKTPERERHEADTDGGVFAYRDAHGRLQERAAYMEAALLPTDSEFYLRGISVRRRREMRAMDRDMQAYLAKVEAAMAARPAPPDFIIM